jgi:hypothetical protein
VRSYFRTIPVIDGNGDELILYEIRERSSPLALVAKKRFELCTGEPVAKSGNGFVIQTTGEKLTPVESAS